MLLVVGGTMITVIALHDGEPARVTPEATPEAPPEAPPDSTPPPSEPAPPAETPTTIAEARSAPGASSAPLSLRIDAIGASAPVDPLGLNADGTLQVPTDYGRAGYYTGRPAPGAVGPAIIAAHVDSKAGPAVFYRLRDLDAGDEIAVTRADGSEVLFVVERVERHAKNAFPTKAVYDPTPGATLRLITCGGSFDKRSGHYRDNVIAFARFSGVTPPGGIKA